MDLIFHNLVFYALKAVLKVLLKKKNSKVSSFQSTLKDSRTKKSKVKKIVALTLKEIRYMQKKTNLSERI